MAWLTTPFLNIWNHTWSGKPRFRKILDPPMWWDFDVGFARSNWTVWLSTLTAALTNTGRRALGVQICGIMATVHRYVNVGSPTKIMMWTWKFCTAAWKKKKRVFSMLLRQYLAQLGNGTSKVLIYNLGSVLLASLSSLVWHKNSRDWLLNLVGRDFDFRPFLHGDDFVNSMHDNIGVWVILQLVVIVAGCLENFTVAIVLVYSWCQRTASQN